MTVSTDATCLDYEPISSLLIQTLLTAFTFLTALSIRDSMTQAISLLSPGNITKKLIFTIFITMLFLLITVIMAYVWQDKN
jgi:hypothetical protein